MPIPFIIGGVALAAAAFGAKKGYDGYQKHSEADEIVKDAKSLYEKKKTEFDQQEKKTTFALDLLGKKELEIGKNLGEFKTLADKLINQLNAGRKHKLEINIPQHQLQKIENYTYTALGVLGSMAGAGAAGAAAGFAVYGGVMALGAASTGTAISSLAGAAATKATLAALGGGSLATGGLGIAGGTAILGAAVAAPVLAIAGWAYDSHGEEALKNARNARDEVKEAVRKMANAVGQLGKTEDYVRKINLSLISVYGHFNQYFEKLKDIDAFLLDVKGRGLDPVAELRKIDREAERIVQNGFVLAAILVNVITTPIFKLRKVNDKIVKNQQGVPEMEKDAEGFSMVNGGELDKSLVEAKELTAKVESA